jgi:predicted GNAT family N-acyltransferase
MKPCYIVKVAPHRIAIADLSKHHDRLNTYVIHRINVPKEFRGQGHARELMRQIIKDADRENVTLTLGISPSDGLTFEQLRQWYERRGFKRVRLNEYDRPAPHGIFTATEIQISGVHVNG